MSRSFQFRIRRIVTSGLVLVAHSINDAHMIATATLLIARPKTRAHRFARQIFHVAELARETRTLSIDLCLVVDRVVQVKRQVLLVESLVVLNNLINGR